MKGCEYTSIQYICTHGLIHAFNLILSSQEKEIIMYQVKEFCNAYSVADEINKWFSENRDIKIIDIKYSADEYSSNALIIYTD